MVGGHDEGYFSQHGWQKVLQDYLFCASFVIFVWLDLIGCVHLVMQMPDVMLKPFK
jgi:hypothetical protein